MVFPLWRSCNSLAYRRKDIAVVKIKVDHTKCIACLACEMACSLHHTGTINPKRSRIRVFMDGDLFYPIIAGPATNVECTTKEIITVDGKEVDGCALCRAACPVKPIFKEPGTNQPLTCDLCGQCVKWCPTEALTIIKLQDKANH